MIANLITLCNLWLGFCVLKGNVQLTTAASYILLGSFLDCIDGGLARLTNTTSNWGKLLDHLADLVTFGLAPTSMMILDRDCVNWNWEWHNVEIRNCVEDGYFMNYSFLIGIYWLVSNLFRECTKRQIGETYLGCPSPFAAGIWSLGILVTDQWITNALFSTSDLWIIISGGWLSYKMMMEDKKYLHDRLIETPPYTKKGIYNLVILASVLTSLCVEGLEGWWRFIWGGFCLNYVWWTHQY